MDDSSKYLIHANFVADGVIERSDVVGAIFGQTEGLLGDGMDLRDLQQASRVGRIDVEVDSESGRSHGTITIATSLDQVETAILAAALETIERVGPCRSQVRIDEIEDVRAAKRREVVERAKELLAEAFDESIMDSQEILEEVRGSARVEEITDYHGLPAGPRVETSDAIIVVEGRADVLALLRCGIKNAIAVEGTNVPDAVAELTRERTVTAFLDGDRGGELILRELDQVGDVDYVVFAPERRSVEDLPRHELMALLRDKRPIEELQDRTLNGSGGEDPHPPNASPGTTESSTARNTDGEAARRDGASGQNDGTGQVDADANDVDPESSGGPASVEDILSAAEEASESSEASTANGSASTEETASAEDSSAASAADTSAESDGSKVESDGSKVESDGSKVESDGSKVESDPSEDVSESAAVEAPPSLRDHVRAVVDGSGPGVRLLDASLEVQATAEVGDAFDALSTIEPVPYAVVFDGELPQRLLDVAAQRGVEHVVASETGEFVKKPIGVRIRTVGELLDPATAS